MRFLIHGTNTTPAVAAALIRHGHTVVPNADAQVDEDSAPDEVLDAARVAQLDVVTTDDALAESPFGTPTDFARTIVYLQLPGGDVEQDDAVDRLFARYKRLTPGRLYTVTETRVKIRQLPGER
jgi:hypothetical protein